MKHFHILVLFLCVGIASRAQTVSGKLLDLTDNSPLKTANLILSQTKDTTIKYNALSDAEGAFTFNGVHVGTYTLQVSSIGYDVYKQAVALTDSIPSLQLGTLFIPKATKELEGVTVVGKQAPVQQKGDTVIYNASQYKVNPDATVEDLIKKMPNVVVGRDGTVTAAGEQVRKVTIDGKDFFGDDASAALKNLPSSVVDKIQVFDRLSDQAQLSGFDDGNSVKSLNIITKSGINNGQFGRIYAGYGTDDRYAAGGNISFFNGNRRLSFIGNFNNVNQQNFGSQDLLGVTSSGGGGRGGGGNRGGGGGNWGGGGGNFQVGQQNGIATTNAIGVNYGDKWGKKVDISGSYFFNQSTTDNISRNSVARQLEEGIRYEYDSSVSRSSNSNHRFNMRLEYKIDSFNSIMVIPSLSFQDNESQSNFVGHTLLGIDSINKQAGNDKSYRNGYNLRNNIMFRHTFKNNRRRSYSISFNQAFNKNDAKSYAYTETGTFKGGIIDNDVLNQYVTNPTNGYTLSGNVSYNEPIGQKGMLQISYQPSFSKNDADRRAYEFNPITNQYETFIQENSSTFENTTTTQNGGVTYRLGSSRDNQFSVGANLQHSVLKSVAIYPVANNFSHSFTNVLPNLMWSRKLNAKSNFRLFYRASTNFPSVNQLQDVVNNINPLRLTSGNPELKQSYNHFLSGRYTFTNTQKGQSFFANVFLNAQQNYVTNAVYIAAADSTVNGVVLKKGSQLIKPINLNGFKNMSTFFTFSQPMNAIKTNLNLSTGFTYSTIPSINNGVENMTDNYGVNGGLVLASNINEYIDFNLYYNIAFNNAENDLTQNKAASTTKFTVQNRGGQINLLSKNGWFLQNDIVNQVNKGTGATPSENFNVNFLLWNAAVGKKFLKNNAAELKLSVFDLLKQNQSVNRTVAGNEITDSWNQVLQQYFMLTFTYSLKNFGKGRAAESQRQWGGQGGPGGMGGGRPPMF